MGNDPTEAAVRLRQLLGEIESGTFVRSSERRRRTLQRVQIGRWTLRQVLADFLDEKRRTHGANTAQNYRSRLMPVLDFAERRENQTRWRWAAEIDRPFAVELKTYLLGCTTTRNGRPGGRPKPISVRQAHNVLVCLRTALAWARRADVRKLPPEWLNPLTPDLIGSPSPKDPLRVDPLPLEVRIDLVRHMDMWQLCQLAPFLVLPFRPDEAAGLVVSDVDFERGWFSIGTRFGGGDTTKAGTSFKLPFPDVLRPLITACAGGRLDGPLLRSRRAFRELAPSERVVPSQDLLALFNDRLARSPNGEVQAPQDRKRVFRRLLRSLGGVSKDALAREFKCLLDRLGRGDQATLYTLRSSVTTAMARADVPHLEMRYLTSHSTADILNAYATLDPVGAMRRYFASIEPLLSAIHSKAQGFGLTTS